MMGEQLPGFPRIFRGNQIGLAQDSDGTDCQIVDISDRHCDQKENAGLRLWIVSSHIRAGPLLTPFLLHRYNFTLISKDTVCARH
jgi:hypothetical protein